MQRTTLNLGPNWRLLSVTTLMVVGLHVIFLFLWWIDGRVNEIPKRRDLAIVFSTPAPLSSTTQAHAAAQAAAAVLHKPVAPTPPEPAPLLSDVLAPSAHVIAEPRAKAPAISSSDANVLPSSLNTDADYPVAELNNPKPLYPLSAIRQGLQGRVLLMVEIQADGRAGRVSIEKSSGHAILDASAMNTVQLWQFNSARKDGVFHAQSIRVPIDFNLK